MRALSIPAILFFLSLLSTGCAYHFGLSPRALPGGYKQVAIPVFKNSTQDVGIEMYFTNALIRRFARSEVARVADKDTSPVIIEGTIKDIKVVTGSAFTQEQLSKLPDAAVLIADYRLVVTSHLILRRKSDDKILWQGNFQNEQAYQAPRVGTPVLNSVNATYNHNARVESISLVADEMMTEAHDRMTENF